MTKESYLAIAENRIVKLLHSCLVVNQSILISKLSEAGGSNKSSVRPNPHIINEALHKLVKEKVVKQQKTPFFNKVYIPCYSLNSFYQAYPELIQKRLNDLFPYLDRLKNNKNKEHAKLHHRLGQALELSIYNRLKILAQESNFKLFGSFKNTHLVYDDVLFKKTEPPNKINGVKTKGRMDFILQTPKETILFECKNIRNWIYPSNKDFIKALQTALDTDSLLVYIARKHHPIMHIFRCAGIITHDTKHQIYPESEYHFALKIRDKNLVGFHDIAICGYEDKRLNDYNRSLDTFFKDHLMVTSVKSRKAFNQSKAYLQQWINKEISLSELYNLVKPNLSYFTRSMQNENVEIENDMNTISLINNYHSMIKHLTTL